MRIIQSAHDLQRLKVKFQSQFGIWSDAGHTIEFKISPKVGGARIKVWEVKDLSAIEKIASYCNLGTIPKRATWRGFDFITDLEKKAEDHFVKGTVHMPNTKHKNFAEFRILKKNVVELTFFHLE